MSKHSLVIFAGTVGSTDFLQKCLAKQGWKVRFATDPEGAIALISELSPAFVLISSDARGEGSRPMVEGMARACGAHVVTFSEKLAAKAHAAKPAPSSHLSLPITMSGFLRAIEGLGPGKGGNIASHQGFKAVASEQKQPAAPQPASHSAPGSPRDARAKARELVSESIKQALSSAITGGAATDCRPPRVGENTRTFCVKTPEFTGYLVVAQGQDMKLSNSLASKLTERLAALVSAAAGRAASIEALEASLGPMSMEDLSRRACSVCSGVNDGFNIAAALVDSPEGSAKALAGETKGMIRIEVRNLMAGIAVDFDLYHYLPLNKKYVKFAHRGALIAESALDRLKAKARYVHAREEDSDLVERHGDRARLIYLLAA
jgi:hypothetical protein